jgi:hypothetical protein
MASHMALKPRVQPALPVSSTAMRKWLLADGPFETASLFMSVRLSRFALAATHQVIHQA